MIRTVDVSSSSANPFTLNGVSTAEGLLNRSANGAFLVFAGYRATPGTAGPSTSPTILRVVGRMNVTGTVDTSTVVGDAFQGQSIRGAASSDGTGYWVVGASGLSDAGVRYAVHNSAGPTSNVFADIPNNRAVSIASNTLFASTAGTTGVPPNGTTIYSLGALPTSNGLYAALPGLMAGTTINGFDLVDLTAAVPGADVLYVADTSSPTTSTGGVRKFVFNGTQWSFIWRANTFVTTPPVTATAACQHVAAVRSGNDTVLICSDTGGTRLITYVDVGGVSATAPTGSLLVTAPANTAYRGVSRAPR